MDRKLQMEATKCLPSQTTSSVRSWYFLEDQVLIMQSWAIIEGLAQSYLNKSQILQKSFWLTNPWLKAKKQFCWTKKKDLVRHAQVIEIGGFLPVQIWFFLLELFAAVHVLSVEVCWFWIVTLLIVSCWEALYRNLGSMTCIPYVVPADSAGSWSRTCSRSLQKHL